jgi:hypothetical protein
MKIFDKPISEYFNHLKIFLALVLVIAISQVFLAVSNVQLAPFDTLIAFSKFIVVFAAGFHIARYNFTYMQAAFSGFLIYLPTIWLQPVFSVMYSAGMDANYLLGITLVAIVGDFILCSIVALVGLFVGQAIAKK